MPWKLINSDYLFTMDDANHKPCEDSGIHLETSLKILSEFVKKN